MKTDIIEQKMNDAHRLASAAMALLQPMLTGVASSPADQVETIISKIIDDMADAIAACGRSA